MFDAFKKNIHTSSHENWPQLGHNCHWYPLMKPWPKLGGRRRYLTDANNRMMDCELSRELEAQGGREGGASEHRPPIAECQQDTTRPQRRLQHVQQALINASDHFLFVSLESLGLVSHLWGSQKATLWGLNRFPLPTQAVPQDWWWLTWRMHQCYTQGKEEHYCVCTFLLDTFALSQISTVKTWRPTCKIMQTAMTITSITTGICNINTS